MSYYCVAIQSIYVRKVRVQMIQTALVLFLQRSTAPGTSIVVSTCQVVHLFFCLFLLLLELDKDVLCVLEDMTLGAARWKELCFITVVVCFFPRLWQYFCTGCSFCWSQRRAFLNLNNQNDGNTVICYNNVTTCTVVPQYHLPKGYN